MAPAVDSRPSSSRLFQSAASTSSLLAQFIASLNQPRARDRSVPAEAPNPLAVLHTSATLLKAHTTKLSLLLINKPFTPSAIGKIIAQDIAGSCLPALMGAIEICAPKLYGELICEEIQRRTMRLFKELKCLMEEVVTLAAAGTSDSVSPGDERGTSRDSLTSTGVVWDACEGLMEIRDLGTIGLVVKKAEEYRAMLDDAIKELKEWSEDGEDASDADSENDVGSDDGTSSLEKMLCGSHKLPKDRIDLRDTLNLSLKRLTLVNTLYRAIIKRRLKTLPSVEASDGHWLRIPPPILIPQVDKLVLILKRIPEETDVLASAFYDLNNDEANDYLQRICASAMEAIKLTAFSWDNKSDEFTSWSEKWADVVSPA